MVIPPGLPPRVGAHSESEADGQLGQQHQYDLDVQEGIKGSCMQARSPWSAPGMHSICLALNPR
jgi:hypothetical protein